MIDISKIIYFLYKKNFKGIINIGTGKSTLLKEIAKIICKKYNKKYEFKDNKKDTYLVANNNKLKKIYKLNIQQNIESIIF